MRIKFIAGILAFFGAHKSYLGTGKTSMIRPALMVMSLVLQLWMFFIVLAFFGFIESSAIMGMSTDEFNRKYNSGNQPQSRNTRRYERGSRRASRTEQRNPRQAQRASRKPYTAPKPKRRAKPRVNPYKTSGLQKFKDYEYEASIEDFKKALEINPDDIAVHWNIACAYSLTELPQKAFFHLDQAVARGFNDFEKIKTHDALAFMRIQDDYDTFVANNFRLGGIKITEKPEEVSGGLLEQLNKLAELRKRGLLSEEEFLLEKEKLLG